MRKIYVLLILSVLIATSCSKDDSDNEILPKSCFEVSNLTLKVGEVLKVSNCSENADNYNFKLNNESITLEELNKKFFNEEGTNIITLEVVSSSGNKDFSSKSITVSDINESLFFPEIHQGTTIFNLDMGFNPYTNNLYIIDRPIWENKYTYRELDKNLNIVSSHLIGGGELDFNSQKAFTMFTKGGGIRIQIPEVSSTTTIRRQVFMFDSNYQTVPLESNSHGYDLNYVKVGDSHVSVGSKRDLNNSNGYLYQGAINELDSDGNIVDSHLILTPNRHTLFGNILKHNDGYIAIGGSFDIENNEFSNFNTKLFFLNKNFELLKEVKLDVDGITLSAIATAFLEPYHVHKLPNNNLVVGSPTGIFITDSEGSVLNKIDLIDEFITFVEANDILIFKDSFVAYERSHIRKYNFSGDLISELEIGGFRSSSGMVEFDGKIWFSGSKKIFPSNDETIFIGAIDENLRLISIK